MEASLYIHVPFCAGACEYCDFYSVTLKPGDHRPERYITTLLLEGERLLEMYPFDLESLPAPGGRIDPLGIPTVFIGGGTPSVLGPEGTSRLLRGLSELIARYSSSPPIEITIEANPETTDEAFLAAIREGGVTRLSLGIQTFYGPSRKAVKRIGDETQLSWRLALAQEYFPGAFSVDLISGLPCQDEKVLLNDIAGILLYRPAHVSLYALTAKLNTSFAVPDEDEAGRLWLCGRDALEKSGYSQYEVSNFCLGGKESLHNIRYWRMYNWLALGPAASGTIINDQRGRGFRYTIPHDVDTWLRSGGCGFFKEQKYPPAIEELDTLTLIKESLLMGFRYFKGPDEDLFRRRFRLGINDLIPKTISSWRERGSLQKGTMALTKDGLLFLNRFLLDAFEELDRSSSELDAVFPAW